MGGELEAYFMGNVFKVFVVVEEEEMQQDCHSSSTRLMEKCLLSLVKMEEIIGFEGITGYYRGK